MNSFMIGQHGSFSYTKYNRDFRDGFYGIEACLFEQEEDTQHLIREAQNQQFHIGIHFPLRAGQSKVRDALFLSMVPPLREQAYRYAQKELEYIGNIRPDYVLFHYPKPVILDDRFDWSLWKFDQPEEYVYESEISFNQFRSKRSSGFNG